VLCLVLYGAALVGVLLTADSPLSLAAEEPEPERLAA
jgi:hypothetical protein